MNISAKRSSRGRHLSALALGAALGALAPACAWAQMGGGGNPGGMHPPAPKAASGEKPPEPGPDPIPGAKSRLPVAPATKAAGDMQPTEALFDAINRGDLAGTRDALNRGADMDGVNILGMTPLEVSVDLGRNDITFLLLSMRGEDSGRGSRAARHGTAGAGKTANAVPVQTAPVAKTAVAARPVVPSKQFAADGGTPVPSAGFLGFGSRPASN